MHLTRLHDSFLRPSLAKFVIEKLRGSRVLDFSAGWGDRLVGAAAAKTVLSYQAFDPNTDLIAGHTAIIERLVDEPRRKNFSVIYEPAQHVELPYGRTYDLIFTSPPFFDLEIYTDKARQPPLLFPKKKRKRKKPKNGYFSFSFFFHVSALHRPARAAGHAFRRVYADRMLVGVHLQSDAMQCNPMHGFRRVSRCWTLAPGTHGWSASCSSVFASFGRCSSLAGTWPST